MAYLHFDPPVIAHRGASAYAPENTLIAFTKAAQLGIKWIEFDVMQSSDQVQIIFHDDLLDRTTNAKGELIQYPYAYLKTLDAGAWFNAKFSGEKIPSLAETLEFLKNTNLSANIEIKSLPGQEKEVVLQTLAEIKASSLLQHPTQQILFSSFSMEALHYLREYAPHCLLGVLLHEWEPNWQSICTSLQCASIHVNDEIITRATAQEIKHMGKALLCYTVNDPIRAQELFSWGVDAVFSDVPDKILNKK